MTKKSALKESLVRMAENAVRNLGLNLAEEVEKNHRARVQSQAGRLYAAMGKLLNEEQPDLEVAVFILEQMKLTIMNEWRKDSVIDRGVFPMNMPSIQLSDKPPSAIG
jgi:hypothetical protein